MYKMVIQNGRQRTFYQCSHQRHALCRTPEDFVDQDEAITTYYSEQHAKDDGWKCTDSLLFCDPDHNYAWVCPECAKEVDWTKKRNPEFCSRKTKIDRRKEERRKINTYYVENDRRKGPRRDQDRRGKAQRAIAKKCRQEFERHLNAQR